MSQQINYNNMTNKAGFVVIPTLTEATYFIQHSALPAMRLQNIATPYQQGMANIAGETLVYDPLVLDFLADEDNVVRDTLCEWMVDIAQSDNPMSKYKDLTLHLHTRNDRPDLVYTFVGAHVTDVEQLSFATDIGDLDIQPFSATFQYQYWVRRKA